MKKNRTIDLSLSLAAASFKLRNESSYLGILWYLLNPLTLFLIILFIKNAAFSANPILYYPVYLIFGLTLYNFFNKTLTDAINIINQNGNIIKSIKIPYESLIISRTIQSVYSHVFEFILIVIIAIFFKVPLFGFAIYPILFAFFLIFILGLSFLFATIGVYVRDFKNVWAVVSQLLFFITPIFYNIKPDNHLYFVNFFNPLFYFVTVIRDMVIYTKMPTVLMLGFTVLMSFVSLFFGLFIFNAFKSKFAELV